MAKPAEIVTPHTASGQAYYELDSGDHHDHMVCVETGKVIEFTSPEIERLRKAREEAYDALLGESGCAP